MPRKVLLFDIDGTLIWSHGAGSGAFAAALRDCFGDSATVEGVTFHGRTDRAIMRDAFSNCQIDDTPENRGRVVAAYLKRLPEFLTARPGKVLPGAEALLEHLGSLDVAVGLLTGNVRRGADIKLKNYGLAEHFDFGGFGDDHVERNDVAAEALGVVNRKFGPDISRDDIWVLGDTLNDIRCGRHIGVRVLAVATGGATKAELTTEKADIVFDDLSDTYAVLAAMGL